MTRVSSRHAADDLSGRFGYLFEPLEVDESAGDGDGHCPASASPAGTANSHSERLHATAHSGVDSDIPGDVNDGTDHDRRTCSRLTGHGQYIRRPDTGRATDR
jgi:hypothetical protein